MRREIQSINNLNQFVYNTVHMMKFHRMDCVQVK